MTNFKPPPATSWFARISRSVVMGMMLEVTGVAPDLCTHAQNVHFTRDVLPILQEHCIDCHGPDDSESQLRLDTMVGALRGGASGERAIVPGQSDQSYLMELVTSKDSDLRMPPDAEPLPKNQIAVLQQWIDQETSWKDAEQELGKQTTGHWSFQPLIRPALPLASGKNPSSQQAIDRFISDELHKHKLSRSQRASRLRRIRRLFLVMHGMPPTPEEVDAFLADKRPSAWKNLVDQVLSSPRYGERWAQYWLDLVRFGETDGYETNRERPHAWHYRDWVIEAFNDDKPYDQFIIEQLAGDQVGADKGTAFLVAGPVDIVMGKNLELQQMQQQDVFADIINTTSTAFLGLTTGCARCHNHKFDPITQTDYYSMQAVFAGVKHGDKGLALSKKTQLQIAKLDLEIARLKQQLTRFLPESETQEKQTADEPAPKDYHFESWPKAEADLGRSLLAQWTNKTKKRKALATPTLVYAGIFSQPGATHRLYRGDPGIPREITPPAGIAFLGDLSMPHDTAEGQRRLALARWIANGQNPLTARVLVNRLWQFHFGTGFVDTPSDFGGNGSPPTHPELLDWLASEFIDCGWSIKHIHRLILNSDTWQQESRPQEMATRIDATSRYLWRFPPRRLEAEGIRDSILAVTGKLDLRMGGPGFSAFEVALENVRHYFPKKSYGPGEWRRMIYMTKVRQERDAVFGQFDCPDGSQVTPKRGRSTTPLQALNLLNSRFVMQQAELLAERLQKEYPGDTVSETQARIQRSYELCFNRPPDTEEMTSAIKFIDQTGWHQFARALLNANEFVFIP